MEFEKGHTGQLFCIVIMIHPQRIRCDLILREPVPDIVHMLDLLLPPLGRNHIHHPEGEEYHDDGDDEDEPDHLREAII